MRTTRLVLSLMVPAYDDWQSVCPSRHAANTGWQGFLDNHQPELDYGLSDFSVKNRMVSTAVDGLPFGIGQNMLGGMNRAADLRKK